jgi:predicted ATPase with chaperone activity
LHRVRRVARTIADLEDAGDVLDEGIVSMALNMRVDPAAWAREVAA